MIHHYRSGELPHLGDVVEQGGSVGIVRNVGETFLSVDWILSHLEMAGGSENPDDLYLRHRRHEVGQYELIHSFDMGWTVYKKGSKFATFHGLATQEKAIDRLNRRMT